MLDIEREKMARVDLITISGRVDSNTSPELVDALNTCLDENRYNLVLDMSDVDYLSSAGLRAMVSARRACNQHGGDVRVAAPSERVEEVLSLAGLDAIFQTYNSTVAAVGSF
jgi:anti-sigma B factor antagonist